MSLIEFAVTPGVAMLAGCATTFAVRGLALVYSLSLPVFVHRNDREGGAGPTPREVEDRSKL